MKTEKELKKWIASSGQYLREKDLRDRLLNRPSIDSLNEHPDKSVCFYDYDGFVSELDSLERDLEAADKRLQQLTTHFTFNRMAPFGNQEHRIFAAREFALNALVQARLAKHELRIEHPARTRSLSLEKSAVQLAAAFFPSGDRRVRGVAREIMEAAGLEIVTVDGESKPSNATISNWIKELREEDSGNAK